MQMKSNGMPDLCQTLFNYLMVADVVPSAAENANIVEGPSVF